MLEGKGDAFGFIPNVKQRETTANLMKAISQNESQEMLAHQSHLC
jgi:hypothetical protein